jgi:hypothetical protein
MDVIHGLEIETTREQLFQALPTDTRYAWAQFLRSLKLLPETGKGQPFGSPASLPAGRTLHR